jgi:hypothetical protein
MVPASFDECNAILSKPQNMTADECEPLQVLCKQTEAGYPIVVSCWKLTVEELAEVNRTGRVWLTVFGPTMMPVCLDGKRPF